MVERQTSTEKLVMELVATNLRTDERMARMEKVVTELVATNLRMDERMARMEASQAAIAEITRAGFERVGQALDKTNLRIDETNRSVRLHIAATTWALEHDDSRIDSLERRVQALEKKSA